MACDCGTPWNFLLTFNFFISQSLLAFVEVGHISLCSIIVSPINKWHLYREKKDKSYCNIEPLMYWIYVLFVSIEVRYKVDGKTRYEFHILPKAPNRKETKHKGPHEPQHDKTNKMTLRPAKTQISLGIRPVWSESSLCAQWVAKDPSFLHADSEVWSEWVDAQADRSLRWAHMPYCWFCREAAHIMNGKRREHLLSSRCPPA